MRLCFRAFGAVKLMTSGASPIAQMSGAVFSATPPEAKLAKLLAHAPAGIVYDEHTDEDGAVVFRHACKLDRAVIVRVEGLRSPRQSGGGAGR